MVTNNGSLIADGGYVQLSAKTAENLMLGAVNVGSSGIISSASIDHRTGNVVIGGDDNNFVNIEGTINILPQIHRHPLVLLTLLVLMYIMEEVPLLAVQLVVKFQPKLKKCLFSIVL